MPKITVMKCGRCPRTFESTEAAVSVRVLLAKSEDIDAMAGTRGFESPMDALRAHDCDAGESGPTVRVVEYEDLCEHCSKALVRFIDEYERAYNKPKKKRARKAKSATATGPQLDAFAGIEADVAHAPGHE